jgi:hypothetical protein
MRNAAIAVSVALVLTLATAGSARAESWLHVVVEEGDDDGDTVRIQLPLKSVESVLPFIGDKVRGGKLKLEDEELDLRSIWSGLRDAPDGDFVTVKSRGEKVRVGKEGGYVVVHATEGGRGDKRVDIRMPVQVVDALLRSGPNELDVAAALRALESAGRGELVRLTDGDSRVRIWIDSGEAE